MSQFIKNNYSSYNSIIQLLNLLNEPYYLRNNQIIKQYICYFEKRNEINNLITWRNELHQITLLEICAIKLGSYELTKYLLEHGANPDKVNSNGKTCLDIIYNKQLNNYEDIVNLLIDNGATLNKLENNKTKFSLSKWLMKKLF